MIKLKDLLFEADIFGNVADTSTGQAQDQIEKELEKEMGNSLKDLEAELKANAKDAKAEVEAIDESRLNEDFGVTAIIGLILAAPKIIELITKGISGLVKAVKKVLGKDVTGEDKIAKAIIDFTHKWHKGYIKIVYYILLYTGIFKKAQVTDEAERMKAASMLYYVIIAGMAVAAGVGAFGAFKAAVETSVHGSNFALGAIETAMASIKTGEVASFIKQIGIA